MAVCGGGGGAGVTGAGVRYISERKHFSCESSFPSKGKEERGGRWDGGGGRGGKEIFFLCIK